MPSLLTLECQNIRRIARDNFLLQAFVLGRVETKQPYLTSLTSMLSKGLTHFFSSIIIKILAASTSHSPHVLTIGKVSKRRILTAAILMMRVVLLLSGAARIL